MNKSKNILVISPFFYPEPIGTGKFNTSIVEELNKKGHKVTILCFHPFYPKWKSEKNEEKIEGVKIIRGGKNIFYSKKTFFRRIILEISFAFFVLRKLRKHQKNKDIIIPVFPPSFAFYCILFFINKKIKKVGMIHDLQEIYSFNNKGIFYKIINFFIHIVEKKCYNSCNKLIFLSNEIKTEATKLYKLESVNLEVQYPFISLVDKLTNNLNNILKPENINIVYSGALGEKQNPNELYKIFNFLSNKIENTVFHFFSQGEIFNRLKDENLNQKIKFHDLVSKENLGELYKKSDVQILPQLAGTSKGSLPSKLPNILVSGCKVLVITDKNSEIDSLFKRLKLTKIINSWNRDIILQGLKDLLNLKQDQTLQIKAAKDLFTIDKMINKILN